MSLASHLSMLIGLAYESTRDPKHWRAFLKSFASCFPGIAVSLEVRRYIQEETPFNLHEGYPAGSVEDWYANFAEECPWVPLKRKGELDDAYDLSERYPCDKLELTEFYRDWCVPNGFGSGFAVKVYDDADGYATLVVDCAPKLAAAIKPDILELMRLLSPHIRRSLEMRSILRDRRGRAMRDLVGSSAEPVLILDSEGGILLANGSAELALKQKTIIARRPNGVLALPGVATVKRITEALALAAEPTSTQDGKRTLLPCKSTVDGKLGVIEIMRLRIQSVPLAGDVPFGGQPDGPCYRLSARTLEPAILPTEKELQAGLALSAIEAELVAGLLKGESIKGLAEARRTTVDGVKWHFRNIYQKLGCGTQPELITTVLGLLHL